MDVTLRSISRDARFVSRKKYIVGLFSLVVGPIESMEISVEVQVNVMYQDIPREEEIGEFQKVLQAKVSNGGI